jgi:hypothetical protein
MRLTEDQVLGKLLHPERDVRCGAFRYFAESFSRNPAVMPAVLEGIRKYGIDDAYGPCPQLDRLLQSEASVAWAVDQLLEHASKCGHSRKKPWESVLAKATPELLVAYRSRIELASDLRPEIADRILRRIEYASLPIRGLWQRLELLCQANQDEQILEPAVSDEGEDIARAIACHASAEDRVVTLLGADFDRSSPGAMLWLELFAIFIAGEMRSEAAIPGLIAKLKVDDEYNLEWSMEALIKIGTDSVIRAMREAYPDAADYFQLYGSTVFGTIHSDFATATGLELLALDCHTEDRWHLAMSLVDQLSTEAVDAARELIAEEGFVPDLAYATVEACPVMEYEFPELEEWKRKLEPEPLTLSSSISRPNAMRPPMDAPAPAVAPMVMVTRKAPPGPDDLCPCGSGKKFKKCCRKKPK